MPFITEDLMPVVSLVCDDRLGRPVNRDQIISKDQDGFAITGKIGYTEYQKLMKSVNTKIMEKLFGFLACLLRMKMTYWSHKKNLKSK